MQELKPYATLTEAKKALDNGGHIFNLLAMANDDVITSDELAKAAGVFLNESRAFLHLHMATAILSAQDRATILSLLKPSVAERYQKVGPRATLAASQVPTNSPAGTLIVAEGFPRFEAETTQSRTTMIMVGKVFVPLVVKDRYATYELFDNPEWKGSAILVAATHGSPHLQNRRVRIGGAMRQFKLESPSDTKEGIFLEGHLITFLT